MDFRKRCMPPTGFSLTVGFVNGNQEGWQKPMCCRYVATCNYVYTWLTFHFRNGSANDLLFHWGSPQWSNYLWLSSVTFLNGLLMIVISSEHCGFDCYIVWDKYFYIGKGKFTVEHQRGDTHIIKKGAQRRARLPKKAFATLPLTKGVRFWTSQNK